METETSVIVQVNNRRLEISKTDMAILQSEGISQSVLVTLLLVFGEIALRAIIDRILARHRNKANFQFALGDLGVGALKALTVDLLQKYRDTLSDAAKTGAEATIDAVISLLSAAE